MRRFANAERDLFGQDSYLDVTSGEHYLISEYFFKNDDFISRADWVFENLPYTGTLQLELEDHLLLSDALKAYIFGLYALVIIGADAFCERILTDAIESREDTKIAKKGLWYIIKTAKKQGFINKYLLDRILRLRTIRNGLCHAKDDLEIKLDHRSLREGRHHLYLVKQDAKEALCLMYGLAAQQPRNFPRLAIPGVGIVDKLRKDYSARKQNKRSG